MGDRTTVLAAREVLAVEPAIRRVVAARAVNPADVDDLVQDCLERLLMASERLAPEAVLPYGVVVARNLVAAHAKSAMRHAAAAPRLLDASEPERPDEAMLTGETRNAMMAALAQLSDQERRDVLVYYSADSSEAPTGPSPGALRVRMARSRAKLRLEYLLAFRHLELPAQRCRGVLLAISAGDTRRQRELEAGQHLLDCEICATLSQPLERRSIALTAIAIPGGLAAWAAGKVRAHPVHAVAVTAAGVAAVAVALSLNPSPRGSLPAPAAPAAPAVASSAPAPPRPEPVISDLSIAGRPVREIKARESLTALIGRAAHGTGALVVDAVTRDGFWIGSSSARVWVELVGPLRALRIQAGDRVWFTGTVVGNSPSFSTLAPRGGALALLARQGAHLAVSTTRISVKG